MRDYWLTQYLLQVVGWGYAVAVLLALLIAAWAPRRNPHKVLWMLIVLGAASILPIKGYRQYEEQKQLSEERKQKYAKAKALFDERCKTAGEKIYRTVEGVEGVLLMNVRSAEDRYKKDSDPNWPDAGLAQQYGGEDYIKSFLQWEHWQNPLERGTLYSLPTNSNNYQVRPGYSYVDVKEDSGLYRYRFKNSLDPKLNKERLNRAPARYAISFENIIDPADREYWVAGTTVNITDTETQEVIARKTWYSFEPGFGSHAGNRQPWRFAVTCPANKGWGERAPTRFFVDQILKPKQGY